MSPTPFVPILRARWDRPPDVEAFARRMAGARGVHAAVWLRAGSETSLLLFLESTAMRDAYARWLGTAGQRPDRVEAVELLAAAPGRAGAGRLVDALLGPEGRTTVHR